MSGIINSAGSKSGVIGQTEQSGGFIQMFEADNPIIEESSGSTVTKDYSYVPGKEYAVLIYGSMGMVSPARWTFETCRISADSTLSSTIGITGLLSQSIPSVGTLRITISDTSDTRTVLWVMIIQLTPTSP